MRTEARVFLLIAGFMYLIGVVYAWGTSASTRIDWSGTATLLLSGTLLTICGLYFGFVARRISLRPEDRERADISERTGTIGFFPPRSYWPFGIALSTVLAGVGIAISQAWLFVVAVLGVLLTIGGMAFEFYVGAQRR